MIENLPLYISLAFVATTLITVIFFWMASHRSKPTLAIIILWLALQALLGLKGFYTITNTIPPRLVVMVLPALFTIIALFTTTKGRQFIDGLDLKVLTLMNVIRIPVEVILMLLFIHKQIPGLMTFEGRNFDIFSGISAPFIYYFGFVKPVLSKKWLIAWNVLCLGLVLNVVIQGILSVPTGFQKFAFDQPNVAVLYFPFNWLPAFVVPVVIFSHLVAIRKLIFPVNSLATTPS